MRTSVLSFVGFMTIFFQVLILSTVISHSSYESALEQSLDDSVTMTVYMMQNGFSTNVENSLNANGGVLRKGTLQLDDLTGFKKDFVSLLSSNLDAKFTDLTVDIYGADEEKGILSVEATAKFKYIDGKEGTVSCYKTTILNSNIK